MVQFQSCGQSRWNITCRRIPASPPVPAAGTLHPVVLWEGISFFGPPVLVHWPVDQKQTGITMQGALQGPLGKCVKFEIATASRRCSLYEVEKGECPLRRLPRRRLSVLSLSTALTLFPTKLNRHSLSACFVQHFTLYKTTSRTKSNNRHLPSNAVLIFGYPPDQTRQPSPKCNSPISALPSWQPVPLLPTTPPAARPQRLSASPKLPPSPPPPMHRLSRSRLSSPRTALLLPLLSPSLTRRLRPTRLPTRPPPPQHSSLLETAQAMRLVSTARTLRPRPPAWSAPQSRPHLYPAPHPVAPAPGQLPPPPPRPQQLACMPCTVVCLSVL